MQSTLNKIRHGFSGSAKTYDLFSGLHRDIADILFAQVTKVRAPTALLDVGCGTGYLTGKLQDHFPQCRIVGLDIAQGMLEVARRKRKNVSWVLGDGAQLPFSDGSFDLVVSNLAYQWSGNLIRSFLEARRVLSDEGILACHLFGYHTCQELFQSLDEAAAKALQFTRLPDDSKIREALLVSGFKNFQVNVRQIKIEFKNMQELLAWLKTIGANHLAQEGYLGRETISKAAGIYQERFPYQQGVGVTFEVIGVYAKK